MMMNTNNEKNEKKNFNFYLLGVLKVKNGRRISCKVVQCDLHNFVAFVANWWCGIVMIIHKKNDDWVSCSERISFHTSSHGRELLNTNYLQFNDTLHCYLLEWVANTSFVHTVHRHTISLTRQDIHYGILQSSVWCFSIDLFSHQCCCRNNKIIFSLALSHCSQLSYHTICIFQLCELLSCSQSRCRKKNAIHDKRKISIEKLFKKCEWQ